jgi:class 3 adenylate cyclase
VTDTGDPVSPSIKRRLAAILAADIAGYSRLMGEDEAATVRDLKAHQAVVLPLVGRYGGRIIDTAGDGVLAEFPSVINATECAVEIQTIMATRNEGVPESRRMRFRIGINLGDVIHDEARIYGDGINVAARRENIAEPGGICISRQVFDQVSRALKADFQALGPAHLEEHRATGGRLRDRAGGPRGRLGRGGPQPRRPRAGDPLLHRTRRGPARLLDDRPGAAAGEDG